MSKITDDKVRKLIARSVNIEVIRALESLLASRERERALEKVKRFEVIEYMKGRKYVNMDVNALEFQLQDNNETLKIFVNYKETFKEAE